jgi:hypothetical protein
MVYGIQTGPLKQSFQVGSYTHGHLVWEGAPNKQAPNFIVFFFAGTNFIVLAVINTEGVQRGKGERSIRR